MYDVIELKINETRESQFDCDSMGHDRSNEDINETHPPSIKRVS